VLNELPLCGQPKSTDTLPGISNVDDKPKLSGGFKHKSAARDAVLTAISKHPGWVKFTTIAAEIARSPEGVRKHLSRLTEAGLVDRDHKGHFRKRHERKLRKLKPCSSKPIPLCRGIGKERRMLSRTELAKRGWPVDLIDKMFPKVEKDYIERDICTRDWARIVKARFYWVSRIKAIELQPQFEIERAKILHAAKSI